MTVRNVHQTEEQDMKYACPTVSFGLLLAALLTTALFAGCTFIGVVVFLLLCCGISVVTFALACFILSQTYHGKKLVDRMPKSEGIMYLIKSVCWPLGIVSVVFEGIRCLFEPVIDILNSLFGERKDEEA